MLLPSSLRELARDYGKPRTEISSTVEQYLQNKSNRYHSAVMSGRHPRSFASQSDIWTFVESSNVRKDGVKRGAPLVEIVARSPQSLTKEMQSLDFSTVRRRLVGVSDDPTTIVSDEGGGAEEEEMDTHMDARMDTLVQGSIRIEAKRRAAQTLERINMQLNSIDNMERRKVRRKSLKGRRRSRSRFHINARKVRESVGVVRAMGLQRDYSSALNSRSAANSVASPIHDESSVSDEAVSPHPPRKGSSLNSKRPGGRKQRRNSRNGSITLIAAIAAARPSSAERMDSRPTTAGSSNSNDTHSAHNSRQSSLSLDAAASNATSAAAQQYVGELHKASMKARHASDVSSCAVIEDDPNAPVHFGTIIALQRQAVHQGSKVVTKDKGAGDRWLSVPRRPTPQTVSVPLRGVASARVANAKVRSKPGERTRRKSLEKVSVEPKRVDSSPASRAKGEGLSTLNWTGSTCTMGPRPRKAKSAEDDSAFSSSSGGGSSSSSSTRNARKPIESVVFFRIINPKNLEDVGPVRFSEDVWLLPVLPHHAWMLEGETKSKRGHDGWGCILGAHVHQGATLTSATTPTPTGSRPGTGGGGGRAGNGSGGRPSLRGGNGGSLGEGEGSFRDRRNKGQHTAANLGTVSTFLVYLPTLLQHDDSTQSLADASTDPSFNAHAFAATGGRGKISRVARATNSRAINVGQWRFFDAHAKRRTSSSAGEGRSNRGGAGGEIMNMSQVRIQHEWVHLCHNGDEVALRQPSEDDDLATRSSSIWTVRVVRAQTRTGKGRTMMRKEQALFRARDQLITSASLREGGTTHAEVRTVSGDDIVLQSGHLFPHRLRQIRQNSEIKGASALLVSQVDIVAHLGEHLEDTKQGQNTLRRQQEKDRNLLLKTAQYNHQMRASGNLVRPGSPLPSKKGLFGLVRSTSHAHFGAAGRRKGISALGRGSPDSSTASSNLRIQMALTGAPWVNGRNGAHGGGGAKRSGPSHLDVDSAGNVGHGGHGAGQENGKGGSDAASYSWMYRDEKPINPLCRTYYHLEHEDMLIRQTLLEQGSGEMHHEDANSATKVDAMGPKVFIYFIG